MNRKTAVMALFLIQLGMSDTPGTKAPLQPTDARKPAGDFLLRDAAGKEVQLKDYLGKVLVLDFWATWCTGCKKEIPWFEGFQKSYGKEGFAVVGVSMDEDGWKVLKPFLDEHKPAYRMILGDEEMGKRYGINGLPDTFLIDRHGRVAAAYIEGLVDREDIESNIRSLVAEK